MGFLTQSKASSDGYVERNLSLTKVGVLLGCFLGAATAMAQSHDARLTSPVAVVDGLTLYEEDLLPATQSQLLPLRSQEYDIKKKALDDLIQQKLLESAAKKKGVSTEQLLVQEVDAKVAEPSDAEVQGYYMALRDRTKSSFAEIQVQLKQSLKQAMVQQARQDYMKRLRDGADVVVELSAPRVNVAYDPARVRGNADAPVTIVEFSDYQCPYCHQVEPTIAAVLAKYGDKVRFAYRDFPLRNIHDHAEIAAEASRCALEQGKFWDYHDQLFKGTNLDKEALVGYARNAKMDQQQFESCLTSDKYKAQIDKDIEEGRKAGVSGTPTFFINGISTSGAQQPDAFTRIIDDELAKKPAMRAWNR
ncbi:MAG TPA: thioredoxin domain-containing protein [Acidobacteriaceae bacterium]|jgi:protein-disulfide isomerase|nr:thioredoxin domain-containing protein [Acidobacteriaceae bacterium]